MTMVHHGWDYDKNMNEARVTFGDAVEITSDAPRSSSPGMQGSVFSIYVVDNANYAATHHVEVGTIMIGIENGEGTSVEVDQKYVVKI